MKLKRLSVVLLASLSSLLLVSCTSSPGAKTEVKPGSSSAEGSIVETQPSNTKKTRTVLRIRPVPPPVPSQENRR